MFNKHFSELDYIDIDDLINNRLEREGYRLDFKGEIGNPDKAKKELSKDISAFANTGGGYLIIGVDKYYKILGIEKTIQNKPIDEWINQILSTNIEPTVFYFDPKIITIPDSEKVLVILYIPESTKKPHIVTEWNNYYIRINDSSKSANHNQIRDMFEFSKNRASELEAFLKKKNLYDETDPDFGKNKNSHSLRSSVEKLTDWPKPIVLYSIIPKYPNQEKIQIPLKEFKIWLNKHSSGYYPYPSFSLYHIGYDFDLKLDGILLRQTQNNEITSYFEISNNGYLEAGLSNSVTYPFGKKETKQEVAIYLTSIIAYEMFIIGFATKLFELIKYYDDVMIQLSFINVLNLKLFGFNKKYNRMALYEMSEIANKHHNNFKLIYTFNPKTISDEEILRVAKQHSEKICRVFGLEDELCFVDDTLSVSDLNNFRL